MRARLRALRDDERGISLVELIVAMAVTSLLLALVGSFFVSMTRAQQTVQSVSGSTRQGTTAVQQLSRYLREAQRLQLTRTTSSPAFDVASPTRVVFYSAVDTTNSTTGLARVTAELQSGALRLTTVQGTRVGDGWTFTGSARSVVLADPVRGGRPDDPAVFAFSSATGPVTNLATAAGRDIIRTVGLHLQVGSTSGAGDSDTTFDVDVDLRNLDYGSAAS